MEKKILRDVMIQREDELKNSDLLIEDGIITEIKIKEGVSDTYAVAGFIDTHIHGFGGYGTEDGESESILKMSQKLLRHGVTSFFPTIYTDTTERMEKDILAIEKAKGREKGASIRGIHIEGPFISPKRIGAQNPEGRKDPDVKLFRHLVSLAPDLVKAMTIAPELKGVKEIADAAKEYGIILLAGHTDATFDDVKYGYECGIRHTTHLFNAMKGLHHREPGTVGGVFALDGMSAEVILDGHHVHPEVVKIALKIKGEESIIGITDALKPTAQEEGEKTANGVPVVKRDGLWVTKGNEDLIQGSALTMHQAYKNLIKWNIPRKTAGKLTSENAARLYKLDDVGKIEVGKRADIVILDEENNIKEVIKG